MMSFQLKNFFGLIGIVALFIGSAVGVGQSNYHGEIKQWRERREAALKADDGWLSVAGLFWLKEGKNSVGSATDSDIVLPKPAPERVGTFE